MRKIIGIVGTLDNQGFEKGIFYKLSKYYLKAISFGGGAGVILPMTKNHEIIKNYVSIIDGLILPGGGDVSPVWLDTEPHNTLSSVLFERDYFEFKLVEECIKQRVPILGICRGMQLINLAMGGSIYQDLSSSIGSSVCHKQNFSYLEQNHKIHIRPYSALHHIFKRNTIFVNSMHHQGIDEVGEHLVPIAHSEDGLVEAIQSNQGHSFVLGVQFHPELLLKKGFGAIFTYFIEEIKNGSNEGIIKIQKGPKKIF